MSGAEIEVDACWSRIGVGGDGSCPELIGVIHCRNCAVYGRAGRQLLERSAPAGYLEDWAEQLAQAQAEEAVDTLALVVFRIGGERLALPAAEFVEVIDVLPLHALPHRSTPVLLGVVNVRGELQLCVSLAQLLGIEAKAPAAGQARALRPRLAVIERLGEVWVFVADEVLGVHRIDRRELAPPPATVSRDQTAITAALFDLAGERTALLDGDLLFARLRRAIA